MRKFAKKAISCIAALSMTVCMITVARAETKADEENSITQVITTEADSSVAGEENSTTAVEDVTTTEATTTKEQATQTSTVQTVSFSVEKFTIGQGYLVEPEIVTITDGDTVATVFKKVMDAKGYKYNAGESSFYLSTIENADTGVIDIPAPITKMESSQAYGGNYSAPSNVKNDGNDLPNKGLGEFSYNKMAGWNFTVNGVASSTSADKTKVNGADVIRFQFSVYGWGADLGIDSMVEYTGIKVLNVAKKDALTELVAKANSNKTVLMKYDSFKTAYENAMIVLKYFDAAQVRVDEAATALKTAMEQALAAEANNATTTQQVQSTTGNTYPGVARASIKTVKNVKKKKAKITVKKIIGVSGYQYKYSTKKNFKASATKTKTTSKTAITTKAFKKNQRCYVKVRAYKKFKGSKVFGKWSKIKSVKIKK